MRVRISKEEIYRWYYKYTGQGLGYSIPDFLELEAEPVQDGGTGEKCCKKCRDYDNDCGLICFLPDCPCHSADKKETWLVKNEQGFLEVTRKEPLNWHGSEEERLKSLRDKPTTDTSDNWETGIKDLFDEEMMSELLKISPDAVRRLTERIREVMERARKEGFALRMETDFEAGRAAERASLREKLEPILNDLTELLVSGHNCKADAVCAFYDKVSPFGKRLSHLLDTLKDTH